MLPDCESQSSVNWFALESIPRSLFPLAEGQLPEARLQKWALRLVLELLDWGEALSGPAVFGSRTAALAALACATLCFVLVCFRGGL